MSSPTFLPVTAVPRRTVIGTGLALGVGAAVSAHANTAAAQPTGTTVTASSFGFDPTDSTTALQAALDSSADIVIIDNVGADWITRPLFVRRSNVTIVIEDGVTIRALTGGFPLLGDCLVTVDDQAHVTILGYGAQLIMNKDEYTSGEWRMCLSLRSVRHVIVEGVALRDSGGDGIYLGVSGTNPAAPRHNLDVTIRNVVCDNHRRNSLSVISVDGLLVEGSTFSNADGTPPRAGVDFEPNSADERITNAVVRDCSFLGNWTTQVLFALVYLDSTSTPVDIVIDRAILDQQPGGSPVLMFRGSDDEPNGTVEIRNTLIKTVNGSGSIGVWRKDPDNLRLTFRRCVLWNWGNDFLVYQPIRIAAGQPNGTLPLPHHGGVTFDDCVLITDQAPPCLEVVGPATSHLTNVHGHLTVISPDPSTSVELGPDPVNVDLAVTHLQAAPDQAALATQVTVRPTAVAIRAGEPIELEFTRTPEAIDTPMAVEFTLGGSARDRVDHDGVAAMALFGAGAATTTVAVGTRASATGSPAPVIIEPAIVDRPFYRTTHPSPPVVVRR